MNLPIEQRYALATDAEAGNRQPGTDARLERMQVRDEIVEPLLGVGAAGGGHHVAAGEDRLEHEAFVGGPAAGQKRFLEKALEAGAVFSWDGVGVVAGCAGLLVDVAAAGLLRVQPQLRVGF